MSTKTDLLANSCCSARLMMPIFGLASRIQETVNRIAGMTSGMSDKAKNSDLKAVLVRSLTQAKNVPIVKASAADPAAKAAELPSRRKVSPLA